MTSAAGAPSGRGADVLRRLVHRLLRLGVVAATAAAKGVAAIVVTFLAVVGAILGGGAVFACLILVGVGAAAIGFEREAGDGATPLSAEGRRAILGWAVLAMVAVLSVAGAAALGGISVGALAAVPVAVVAVVRARRAGSPPEPAHPAAVPRRAVPQTTVPRTAVPRTAVRRKAVPSMDGTDRVDALDEGARFVSPAAWHLDQRATAELVHAWRRSFLLLPAACGDPLRLAEISEQRRAYLDELCRRDPVGFQRWIESGARAAGDPSRYLTLGPPPMCRETGVPGQDDFGQTAGDRP